MEMTKNSLNHSVLVSAALNKNPNMFGAVLSGVEKDLAPQEVRDSDAVEICSSQTCSMVGYILRQFTMRVLPDFLGKRSTTTLLILLKKTL